MIDFTGMLKIDAEEFFTINNSGGEAGSDVDIGALVIALSEPQAGGRGGNGSEYSTIGDVLKWQLFDPFGKAGGFQIPRLQGFAVDHYSFTLSALSFEDLRLVQRWRSHFKRTCFLKRSRIVNLIETASENQRLRVERGFYFIWKRFEQIDHGLIFWPCVSHQPRNAILTGRSGQFA